MRSSTGISSEHVRDALRQRSDDGAVRYREGQPFAVDNQNWELDTTENGTVVVGFPCLSQQWYTPREVYDDIADPLDRLVEGDADETRLHSTVVAKTGTVRSTSSTTPIPRVKHPSVSILANVTSSL